MSSRGPRPRGAASSSGARGARGGGARGGGTSTPTIRGPPSSSTANGSGRNTPSAGATAAVATPPPAAITGHASTGIIGHKDTSGRITAYTSPDDQCPQCKTDRFLNPRLKLLVSPCYHKLCTSCIDRIWALGPAPCPECGNVCRKSQFGQQTFQDLGVEREVDVRKRMQRIFSRPATSFATLKEYNDYLEEGEQLTFNLIHGIDVAETNARIAAFSTASANAAESASDAASSLQTALDAHSANAKRARLERYRGYAREDDALKREQERAIVAALETGAEEEDIERLQGDYKRRRAELEQRRDEEEQEVLAREEEERAAIAAGGDGEGKKSKDASSKRATAGAVPPSSLQLFTGSNPTLSDGSHLLPSLHNLTPPHPLSTALNSSSTPFVPYDPWTSKTYTEQMDDDERRKLNAQGWDAGMAWSIQCRVAVQSLGVRASGEGE